jgi:hypothetical protein
MSQVTKCDGCGVRLTPYPINYRAGHRECVISGRRANDMLGGRPLPDGQFDWCEKCALVAFIAVEDAQRRDD